MKRNLLTLVAGAALLTGFVVAQSPGTQYPSDQSQQTPQTQQQPAPDTQPTPQSQSQTGAMGQSVQSQIQAQPELSKVTVNESNDKIELEGTVATKEDKEKAKSIAESNAGGRKVKNKIKVSSNESTPQTTTAPPQ